MDIKEQIAKYILNINHWDLVDLLKESDPCRMDDHWCHHLCNKAVCEINNKPIKSLKRCPAVDNEALHLADKIMSIPEIKEALSLLELSNTADQLFKGREISLKELMKLYIDGKLVKLSDNQELPHLECLVWYFPASRQLVS